MYRWGREPGEEVISSHALALIIGFGALIVAALFLQWGTEKGGWQPAVATIQSVSVKCQLRDVGRIGWGRSRTGPVVIPCDQVDRFRADNSHRHWSSTRVYGTTVLVSGGAQLVQLEMSLVSGDIGETPQVGGQFPLVQNSAQPSQVAFPDKGLSETMIGFMVGGLGAFVLALAFFWL